MKDYLINFLKENNIDLSGEVVTVAVSTGLDSMSLLHSLIEAKEEANFKIVVCHVNHNKRAESKEEEEFILDFCMKKGIECFVKSIDFKDTTNFQEVARGKRYEFFYDVMDKVGSKYLFLAHHLDDLAETIIMRIIRGTSLNGYSGFHGVSSFNNHIIVRPFINLSKEDLINYQKEKGFKYYNDSSNDLDDYTRNKIRHLVLGELKKIDNNVLEKFSDFSYDMDESSKIVMSKVHEIIDEVINVDSERVSFNRNDLLKYSPFLVREVLFEVLKPYKLSKKNISEIIKWIESNKANFRNSYKNIEFIKEYDLITIAKISDKSNDSYSEVVIDGLGEFKLNDNILINVSLNLSGRNANSNELCYNIKKLPITIRNRVPGDKIKLSYGYKKVKDLLINEKVELSRREKILVASKDDEVLCIFGLKKSSNLSKDDNDIIIRIEER